MNIESKDIYGDYPTKPCVFAACDSKYFIDHAGPFINSAHKSGKPVHVHVINPTKEVYADIEFYKEKISTTMTFTFNDMDLPEDQDQKKCIYASLRFFVLPFLLEKVQKIMVLDIDCLVMKDFKFPTKPCGLFVRQPVTYLTDWIREGTKIAAGIVYFDKSYLDKTKKLIEIINSLPKTWYADQVALNKLLTEHINHEDVFVFNGNFMDWNFIEGTVIWTGKGKSKYDNPKYVAMKRAMSL
jgi:hypothetical protein